MTAGVPTFSCRWQAFLADWRRDLPAVLSGDKTDDGLATTYERWVSPLRGRSRPEFRGSRKDLMATTEKRNARIKNLHAIGRSYREIATEMSVSYQVAWKAVNGG